jgi:hypothetical protein
MVCQFASYSESSWSCVRVLVATVSIIQLIRIRSEGYDFVAPLILHLESSPQVVFPLVLAIAIMLSIPLFVPANVIFLVVGLTPFILSHPFVYPLVKLVLKSNEKALITHWRTFRDDDRLSDYHWQDGVREVELWENERWDKDKHVWGKDSDRKRWTRSADGWSPINGEEQVRSVPNGVSCC